MKRIVWSAATAALFAAPAPAWAQDDFAAEASAECELALSGDTSVEWDGPYGRGYDVFDGAVSYEPISITVHHRGAGCHFFLAATPMVQGGANVLTNGIGTLAFDLRQNSFGPSILSAAIEGTPSTQIAGTFPDGEGAAPMMLSLDIPPSQYTSSGLYTGQVILRLFRGQPLNATLVAELPITIVAPVPARIEVRSDSFAGDSQQASIDLGELSTGSRRDIGFDIMSNAPVGITVASRNNGALKHRQGVAEIPYRLSADGRLVDLGVGPSPIATRSASQGSTFSVEVAVEPGSYAAGHYEDTLTIAFTAQQ